MSASSDNQYFLVPTIVRTLLNIAVVWFMANFVTAFFIMTGGAAAYILVGILLTVMNIIVRPALKILTSPLRFFASFIALSIVNGLFVRLSVGIVAYMDPSIVTLSVVGGTLGWSIVAMLLGFGNWLVRALMK